VTGGQRCRDGRASVDDHGCTVRVAVLVGGVLDRGEGNVPSPLDSARAIVRIMGMKGGVSKWLRCWRGCRMRLAQPPVGESRRGSPHGLLV
jgi:hypothetical protein